MTKNFIRTLYIAPACFGSTMIANNVSPYYEFMDGKRTNTVLGYRYTVLLTERGYESLSVKVPGPKSLDIKAGEIVHVEFTDLCVRPYVDYRNGNVLAVTATASAVRAVSD